MPYDPGLAARVADVLDTLGERAIRQKSMFGGRGFMTGKSTFVIVYGDGLLVKTPPGEYERSLAEPGVTAFTPGGGKSMTTWVVVPPDAIADDPELGDWVRRALRAVR